MKRVALVSYHCPPVLNAESILVWKTIRQLCQLHDVTILTTEIGAQRVDPMLEIPPAVSVIRSKDPQFHNHFLSRAANRAIGMIADEKILWSMLAGSGIRSHPFDVIYSRSQPGASHMVALRMKRQLGIPWVAQFSDPWASNPYHASHTRLRSSLDKKYESLVVQLADTLVFPTIDLQVMYEQQYPGLHLGAKSVVLPHHTSPDLYQKQPAKLQIQPDKINLAYVGDFYGTRSPEPLLQACARLCETRPELADRMHFHFIGNIESKFLPLLAASRVPISTGKMGYLESLNAMTTADVLLLIDAPNSTGRTPFLPSKLIDYLGAERPIFGITELEGTAPDILRAYGYSVVRPTDVEAIANQLEYWLNHAATPSTKSIDDYSTEVVVGRLAALLDGGTGLGM